VVLLKLDWIFVAILAGTMVPVILIEFRQSILTYQWQTSWSRWWRHAWYYRWVLAAYDYLQEFRIFRLSPLFINHYLHIGGHYISAYRSHSLQMQNLHFIKICWQISSDITADFLFYCFGPYRNRLPLAM
jgi:hypothetical protein